MQDMKKQKQRFKAIFFDKDGVLIDSVETVFNAANETFRHYGAEEWSKERFLKEWWGIRADFVINKMFSKLTEEKRKEIYEYYKKRRVGFENLTKLFPSTIPILKALKDSKKFKVGIATSTSRKIALKLLKDFGISKYIDVVVSGDDAKPKPSPDSILKECELLGVKPEETLFVGDTSVDIEAGKAAGCTTVIVTTSKTREELEKIKGILIIDDLKELKEMLL